MGDPTVTGVDSGAGEFGFELEVCAWADTHWTAVRPSAESAVVARQLGTRNRRWDTVIVEADPAGLRARARFGAAPLDPDLLRVVRHAPATWQWYRDAIPEPEFPWRYVREAVHRAADRGVVETRRTGAGRIECRRVAPYPDWIDRVIAIENKPDLGASAADALSDQLHRDVALALADEVWLATRPTADRVEPALLADMPVEAGVLLMDDGEATVRWEPAQLPVEQPGTRIESNPAGDGHDRSAGRFEYVPPRSKQTTRLAIAERAYGRGWRSYAETMRPDCRHFTLTRRSNGWHPYCHAKQRTQRAAECSGECSEFEPEPPAWRQRGWPIEGGPGATISRLLEARRRRHRPRLEES
ncbi:MAG: DUF5787 family protein [Halobacteriaceae archaeon]